MDLERLFEPAAVAVVGASSTEGKLGHEAMANLAAFDGPAYPVNPNGEGELFGEPFVASVGDVDGPVDLALVCVPPGLVPAVVEECGEAGVGAAVVYAGGFAEAGDDGERLQARLVEAAAAHDLAVLGPNTSGFLRPSDGLFASFVPGVDAVDPGAVAVVAQSGGIAHSLAFQGANEGVGFSGVVGLGNRAVVGFEPVVEYFDADPRTRAIVLHVEGTEDARALLAACRDAGTPVAAYPVGERDVEAFAASHTAAMAGQHELYRAGFAQHGVPVVGSTASLLDGGHALATAPLPDGSAVGVVTAQAGPGIAMADRLQAYGARLPELTPETREALETHLDGTTYAANPVDTGRPGPGFADVAGAVASDPNVDALLVYMLYEPGAGFPPTGIAELPGAVGKPVVFATDGPERLVADDLAGLAARGVPAYLTPERGADALGVLLRRAELRQDIESSRDGEPVRDADAGRDGRGTAGGRPPDDPLDAARAAGRTALSEAEAKRLLADAGVAVPEFRQVGSADEAVEAAGAVGYPVAVKVASPTVAHKSEWGDGAGVSVGLDGSGAVRDAAERVLAAARERGQDVAVLVEESVDVDAGVELLVGGVREPSFGPTVLVGLGGVHAEVLDDVARRLAPVDRAGARAMVESLAAAPLLSGHRGRPAVDRDAVAAVVATVGDLLVERGSIAEIDLNPVLATADGAVALDALVVLTEGA